MRIISSINKWIARYTCWLLMILMVVMIADVLDRAIFTQALFFSYDLCWMLNGAFFILGAGYTLMKDEHTKVDSISGRFSPLIGSINKVVYYLVIFFPFMIFMTIASGKYAYQAFLLGERSPFTSWRPELWPIRSILAIGILLLLLQGIADFVGIIKMLRKGGGRDDS